MPPTLPANLRVAVYGAAIPAEAWLQSLHATLDGAEILQLGETSALDALRGADAACEPSEAILLVESGALLPPHWLPRLLKACVAADADVLSPLGNAIPALNPLPEGAALGDDPVAIDAGCYAFGAAVLLPVPQFLPTCSVWRTRARAWLRAHPGHEGPELPAPLRGVVLDHLFIADPTLPLRGPPPASGPSTQPAPSPLGALRARLTPVTPAHAAYAGLDGRPVVLHVLHGWGGGVEAFVRDLAESDCAHAHLALVARGHSSRRTYGEALELALPAAGFTLLERWPLPRPIAATVEHDASYRDILAGILARFSVDALLVSSLIGHSLDALATGLPTHVVMHDYYPWWPVLHCDFGDRERRFDREELARELARAAAGFPFSSRDADGWWRLRGAYLQALGRARATLVVPSASVRDNLAHVVPELDASAITVLPHGMRPFPGATIAWTPPPRARPRVLVLGRITGGKAAVLLDAIVAEVVRDADLYLLGCGKAGEEFFGRSGVHVEMDYDRDALPAHVARIAPDLALIPASVAETFSYTLSELRALGVPVLATALGSLAERIEHGVDGWLAPPAPDAIVASLRQLLAEPGVLASMRRRLADMPRRSLAGMAQDYARVLALPERRLAAYRLATPSPRELQLAEALQSNLRLQARNKADARTIAAQQEEMHARAEWAHATERRLRDRTEWARTLEAETVRLKDSVAERHGAVEAVTRELRERWAEHVAAQEAWDIERSALEQKRDLLDQVIASRSWRLTRPLRVAARAARGARTWLGFRLRQLAQLGRRFRRSLGTRGVAATFSRIARELAGREQARARVELSLPELPAAGAFEPFAVPTSDTPRVSLVIPVFNHFHHTHACLKSLAAHPGTVPFEAIVVDDCSSDETESNLARIEGIRALRNARNLGFIGACNAGAAVARGEYLVLLNNDTAVQPGWLEALCATFDNFPGCGMAGAKLVYPDGSLQEAGGIVFSDGSAWNYGRGGDPSEPAFEYVREADYCSGAALMIPRALFESFGGLDALYTPAYYEDTDLAFRVREAGLKVYFQPAATVVHFEGATSGTDTGAGIKRYQVVNQEKFAERWRDALPRQPRPGTPIPIAREHRVRGRVLVVDAYVPEPDQDAGSVRLVNLMRLLLDLGWKVTFAPDNRAWVPRYTAALQQMGVEVLYQPAYADPVSWLARNGAALDAVIVLRHYIASSYLPLVRRHAPRARMIFDTVDLHFLREQRLAALNNDAELHRIAAKTRLQELKVMRDSDVTLVVSPVEQELLKVEVPGARVEVLATLHELVGSRRDFAERRDLWFVGGFQHHPNLDAMQWFVGEVWPLIARELPDARFHIVGSKMPASILALASERVVAHGHVPELDGFLDDCRIAVAPLRYGAGVKGKINHSMAHGQPVVATPVAVEGMHLAVGEEVLVAESAAEFAAAVVRLYHDEALWQRLSANGLENVRRHFSFDAARTALSRILPH